MKSSTWIKKKYFKTIGNNHWMFYGEVDGKDKWLFRASSMPIKRHTQINTAANPLDPRWELYYEQRLDVKMAETLKGRRQLLYLWKQQNGVCPICDQKITKITGWHNHHRIRRVDGGEDGAANRVLLHPNCHRKVHSRGIYVEEPRPS